jgi:hypothetical protein
MAVFRAFFSSNIIVRYYTGIELMVSVIFGGIFKYRVLLHKNVNTYFYTRCSLRNFITSDGVMSVVSEICSAWEDFCYVNCLPRKRQRTRIQLCPSRSINTVTLALWRSSMSFALSERGRAGQGTHKSLPRIQIVTGWVAYMKSVTIDSTQLKNTSLFVTDSHACINCDVSQSNFFLLTDENSSRTLFSISHLVCMTKLRMFCAGLFFFVCFESHFYLQAVVIH